MTCKDCIHNGVCRMRKFHNDIEEQTKELGCMDFIARADVQEVKHGEWIKMYNNPDDGNYYCSECHNSTDIAAGRETPIDRELFYCPNCGAKMDGGKMMTAEKALELLNDVELSEKYQDVQEYAEMLIVCKEALKKQIPKKPFAAGEEHIFEKDEWKTIFECPFCGNPYADDSFCSCCGQKLDWSEY